jgi:hypothetical protein
MVTWAQAAAAAPLYNMINYATQQVTTIGQFTSDKSLITNCSLSVTDPTTGIVTNYTISDTESPWSTAESATVFNALWSIYNARLSTFNTQLTAV